MKRKHFLSLKHVLNQEEQKELLKHIQQISGDILKAIHTIIRIEEIDKDKITYHIPDTIIWWPWEQKKPYRVDHLSGERNKLLNILWGKRDDISSDKQIIIEQSILQEIQALSETAKIQIQEICESAFTHENDKTKGNQPIKRNPDLIIKLEELKNTEERIKIFINSGNIL